MFEDLPEMLDRATLRERVGFSDHMIRKLFASLTVYRLPDSNRNFIAKSDLAARLLKADPY